ncbi:MAG: superoxide dismutase [Chloroflexi bacterium]|nr:superoxide dismutase [Chloroflexota bacterium]
MAERQDGLSRRDVLKLAGSGALGAALSGVSLADDAKFTLPPLPYAEDALEPHIDARTMGIHHGKHHAGYTSKLNAAIEGSDLVGMSIEEILGNLDAVPADIRAAVRNNGGGYANHSLFWQIMSPDGGGEPSGELARGITKDFGSYAEFQFAFSVAAKSVFGSGWAWLEVDGGRLRITGMANQDSPLMRGKTPILGIDVWEHAYYLHYQNRRADYIDAWFNVVNWDKVDELYRAAG